MMTTAANALIEIDATPAPAPMQLPASETAAVLQIIDRAARDPNVDVEKMKQLMEMRNKELERIAQQAFNRSMKAAQEEMEPISADAENKQTKSKYATYAKLDRILRPIYTKHGFALSFDEGETPKPDHIRVLCYVTHDDGYTRTYHKDMPSDGKGAKGGDVMTKTHATGAASSYGSRYLLKGIFNVAVGEGDTDGNAPEDDTQPVFITEDQVMQLDDLLSATGADKKKFLTFIGLPSLDKIYASAFDKAVDVIKSHRGGSK